MISDETVEVRCAAVYALGSLLSKDPGLLASTSTSGCGPAPSRTRGGYEAARSSGGPGVLPENRVRQLHERSPMHRQPEMALRPMQTPRMGVDGPGFPVPRETRLSGNTMVYEDGMPVPVPDFGGGGTVAGTSETQRLDELDIALRFSEHRRDVR